MRAYKKIFRYQINKKIRSNLEKIIQIPFGIWIIGTP